VAGLHDLEEKLNSIPVLRVLSLRCTWFMENLLPNIGMIRQAGILGGAMRPDLPVPMIAARDVGKYAAHRLLDLDWSGKAYHELHGERDITMNEATRVIGQAIGKPDLKYRQFPYEDVIIGMMQMGISQSVANSFMEMTRSFKEGVIKFHSPRSAANTTSTRFEDWARDTFAAAYNAQLRAA
jgi:hypothetical protein